MSFAKVLICAALGVVLIKSTAALTAPPFCHSLDCPTYKVITQKSGYELRQYDASRWVGTLVPSLRWKEAVDKGMKMLEGYISGQNSANQKIPMATPVAAKIEPGQGPACASNFTVLFFVPFKYKQNTPKPNDSSIVIVDLPEIKAYVMSYSGNPSDSTVIMNAAKLAETLDIEDAKYVSDFYFAASYDPPYDGLFSNVAAQRHNEVWFLASS